MVNYAVQILSSQRPQIALFMKSIASAVPDLFVVDADAPLDLLCKDDLKLEQVALGKEFHISLGRTVPISVHQIDSVVTMLRQKLQSQKRCRVLSCSYIISGNLVSHMIICSLLASYISFKIFASFLSKQVLDGF